jgi:flagellar hook-associated protein 3
MLMSTLEGGLFTNLGKLVQLQEQLSSGKRISRASDDPGGATLALAYGRRIADAERYTAALQGGRDLIDSASTRLENASGLLTEARSTLVQGLNGTLSADDRHTLARTIDQLRGRLVDIGNDQFDGRYLFGGTETDAQPFTESGPSGARRVSYVGNGQAQQVQIGSLTQLDTSLTGSSIFMAKQRSGTVFNGPTGAASGTSADQGDGSVRLRARHDGTTATLGSGLALVNGGASDTLLGAHTLVVDATAGTVQLDNGTAVSIPASGATNLADFTVTDENGAQLHLDFTGFTGASYSGAVTGAGSLSLDGVNYTSVNFTETDLEMLDPANGVVLHVDTTGMRQSGTDLVVFGGTVNAFDTLQGIANDLDNVDGVSASELHDRLETWLSELDRNHENVLTSLGALGSRSEHAQDLEGSLSEELVQLNELRANVEDVDPAKAVLAMTRAQQTLELVQSSSARLLSQSLLNFLR